MKEENNYIYINREAWNSRATVHIDSDFYDHANFLKGKSSLKEIELELLGNIQGKKILHLQCHFGQDSISLSRLGAEVTGVDLSNTAIQLAKQTAEALGTSTKFICTDIYDLTNHLDEKFDIIFTSYGTIGWLPDLNRWAEIVSHFLKPCGELIFVEFHPVVWMFDDDFTKIHYGYFNSGAIVEKNEGTYADQSANLTLQSVTWNHSLSDVISSLLSQEITLLSIKEYDYSPYNCFNKTVEVSPGKFQILRLEGKIPMVYSLVGKKIG